MGRLRSDITSLASLWAGALANLAATLGFHSIVTHSTSASTYGLLSVLISTGAVATSVANGIQYVLARHLAQVPMGGSRLVTFSVRTCAAPVAGFVLLAAASPLVASYLHLRNPAYVALSGLYGAMTVLVGIPAGLYLGLMRFGAVAVLSCAAAVARIPVFLIMKPALPILAASITSSLLSVTMVVAVAVPASLRAAAADTGQSAEVSGAGEGLVNAVLALVFWIVMAMLGAASRHGLAAAEAGRFNAALLIASAVLFATTPVTNAFFPQIAATRQASPVIRGLVATGAVCAAALAAVAVLGRVAVRIAYGGHYAPPRSLFVTLVASTAVMALVAYLIWAARGLDVASRYLVLAGGLLVTLSVGFAAAFSSSQELLAASPLFASAIPFAVLAAAIAFRLADSSRLAPKC
jgi:hypothetical protein